MKNEHLLLVAVGLLAFAVYKQKARANASENLQLARAEYNQIDAIAKNAFRPNTLTGTLSLSGWAQ